MDLDTQENTDINCFATTTSGNIHFSDVLMVLTNTHYTL